MEGQVAEKQVKVCLKRIPSCDDHHAELVCYVTVRSFVVPDPVSHSRDKTARPCKVKLLERSASPSLVRVHVLQRVNILLPNVRHV